MWVILLEYSVDGIGIFVNVFVVVFPGLFLRGRNGFRDGERFGTCLRNGFLGCAKVHEFWFSDCGYYMVLYHAYTRRELYLFNKLGELTGANESLFFEWLRSCGVVSPWQLCLHCLQDVYRRVSGVYLSHSVRLRLEGNISATFAAQLCHQHVPETERPDL